MAVPRVCFRQNGLPREQGTDDRCKWVWDDSTTCFFGNPNVGRIVYRDSTFGLIVLMVPNFVSIQMF